LAGRAYNGLLLGVLELLLVSSDLRSALGDWRTSSKSLPGYGGYLPFAPEAFAVCTTQVPSEGQIPNTSGFRLRDRQSASDPELPGGIGG
jgi:hypothetical protein